MLSGVKRFVRERERIGASSSVSWLRFPSQLYKPFRMIAGKTGLAQEG